MTTGSPRRDRRWLLFLFALVPAALGIVLGCAGRGINNPPDALIDKPWANVGEIAPSRNGDVQTVAGLAEVFAGKPPTPVPGKPLNMLIMSGGGKYGAFTSGVLAGWTGTGTRPTFDVATGISSGAVTALLAFLGPKYDPLLTRYFTAQTRADLYTWKPIRGLLSGTGIMSADPAERTIARDLNDELLCDLRAAYAEGRRVYVATGNVLTNRPAIWDLGAIASSGRPDAPVLLRKIMLATISPPGVVAPVEIDVEVNGVRYTEKHGDAGNMYQAFVRTPNGVPPGSTAWVLSAGKLYRDPLHEPPRVFGLIGGAVSNSLYALFRADLMNVYALCAVSQSQFRLIVLPQDFQVTASAFAFDPAELSRLYWVGYQMGAGSGSWHTVPPGTLPGEASPPRIGVQFVAPQ
jgi:hypothetical protein